MQSGLPKKGRPRQEVLDEVKALNAGGLVERAARFSAISMKGRIEAQQLGKEAANEFYAHNAVYSPVIPGLGKIEDDLIGYVVDIFRGGEEGRANLTAGGTDSIYCALHAMREWGKAARPGATRSKVLVPFSGHAAFGRACHYFGMERVKVPLGEDYRADLAAVEALVDEHTIGIVGSAPSFPYGRYDDIPALGRIARRHGLWFHVDACLGGFMAPFVRLAGYSLPPFDFTVPGVCSISADLHKYGHAPKGISTVSWRSEAYQQYHYVLFDDWPEGPYFSQSMLGSRPASPAVAAWAILNYLGEEGKVEIARDAMRFKERFEREVAALPGAKVFETDLTPIVFTVDYDPEQFLGGMLQRGWYLMGHMDPPLFQVILDSYPGELADELITGIRDVLAALRRGEGFPKVGLGYTFSEGGEEALAHLPLWVRRAVPLMNRI
jgi:glutamate/tyrosine decarboxylase-like PLP-dependent enzyme